MCPMFQKPTYSDPLAQNSSFLIENLDRSFREDLYENELGFRTPYAPPPGMRSVLIIKEVQQIVGVSNEDEFTGDEDQVAENLKKFLGQSAAQEVLNVILNHTQQIAAKVNSFDLHETVQNVAKLQLARNAEFHKVKEKSNAFLG
ncbi:hypothetical protein M5689_007204 [Euphorbia peplus]|nr:hypothetical protein M5689_007204 [Euphorbia peplus]